MYNTCESRIKVGGVLSERRGKRMINKISLKFVFGFFGILAVALVILVVTSYMNENDFVETAPDMNMAEELV